MGLAGEDDVARGEIDAGNERIGLVLLQHSGGLVEIVGGEEFDVRKSGDGLLGDFVLSEFWKDDFHEIIIAYLAGA